MGRKVWVPAVSGPLSPYAAGFSSWMASREYSPSAAADRLYQFDQLSRWLDREGLAVGESDRRAGRAVRRVASCGGRRDVGGLASSVALPLEYLRAAGVGAGTGTGLPARSAGGAAR